MSTKKTQKSKTPPRKPHRSVVTGGDAPQTVQGAQVIPLPPVRLGDTSELTPLEQARLGRAKLDAIAGTFNTAERRVLVCGDEAPNPYLIRRPTGITDLDVDLAGGWPAGGLCFASGPDNSGKTWLTLRTLVMQQLIYGDAFTGAVAITEGGFPYDQCIKAGVRIAIPDEMIRQQNQLRRDRHMPELTPQDIQLYKHQVGDIRIARGDTGEEILKVVLKIIASNACSLVIVDSIQGLQPVVDAGKELDENSKRAAHATMLTEFFKRYIPLTTGLNDTNHTTLLMTQQVRSNDAKASAPSHIAKYLPDWIVTGAWSTRHYKLIDVVLSEGGKETKDVVGKGKVVTGKVVKWELEKGKAGAHDYSRGEVDYSYGIPSGVDRVGDLIAVAQRRGVLRQHGKNVCLFRPDTEEALEDYRAPSMKAFRTCLEVDFEFELAVRREVMAAAGIQCLYR